MATYVVLAPPDARVADPAEKAVFIRDGFVWLGFLVPALWLLWHRLWIEAGLAIVALVGLGVVAETVGAMWAGPLFSLLISLFVGLEGQTLRISALTQRGWHDLGVVEAINQDEAETRLILELDDGGVEPTTVSAPVAPKPVIPVVQAPARAQMPVPSFGLVPYARNP